MYNIQYFNLHSELDFNHCEQIVNNLNLKTLLSLDMDEIYSEIIILKEIYKEIMNCEKFIKLSTAEKWKHIFNANSEQTFPNLLKIISYLLSLPATSAFSERIFSIMNIKWRDERNRAQINLINNELLITLNLNFSCNEALDIFVNDTKLLKCAENNSKY